MVDMTTEADAPARDTASEASAPTAAETAAAQRARLLEVWGAPIAAVVCACQGDEAAARDVAELRSAMEARDEWRRLDGVLGRILAGERDSTALLVELDIVDTLIVEEILRDLGGAPPEPPDGAQVPTVERALQDFLELVTRVCGRAAGPELRARVSEATRSLIAAGPVDSSVAALGHALQALIDGQRPDLASLEPRHAALVGEAWERLYGDESAGA